MDLFPLMWTPRSDSPTYTRKIRTLAMQSPSKKKRTNRLSKSRVIYHKRFQAKLTSITKLCKKWETLRKLILDRSQNCFKASLKAVSEQNLICSVFHLQNTSLSSSNPLVPLSNKSAAQSPIQIHSIKIIDNLDQGIKARSNFARPLRTKCISSRNPSAKTCSTTNWTQQNNQTLCTRQRTWTHHLLLNTCSRAMAPLPLFSKTSRTTTMTATLTTVVSQQSRLASSKLWSVGESYLTRARASMRCLSRNRSTRRIRRRIWGIARRKMTIKSNFDSNFSKSI